MTSSQFQILISISSDSHTCSDKWLVQSKNSLSQSTYFYLCYPVSRCSLANCYLSNQDDVKSILIPLPIPSDFHPCLDKWLVQSKNSLSLSIYLRYQSSNQFESVRTTRTCQFSLFPSRVTSSHPRTSSHLSICLCFQSSDQFESRTTRTCLPFLYPQVSYQFESIRTTHVCPVTSIPCEVTSSNP